MIQSILREQVPTIKEFICIDGDGSIQINLQELHQQQTKITN